MKDANSPNDGPPRRVGVIGAGLVSRHHANAVRATIGMEVAAVCDVDLIRARRLAKVHDVDAYADWSAMLAQARLDAVIICLPHALHYSAAIEFLRAGVHTLVEKPLALHLRHCDALIEEADRRGCVLAVGHIQRFLPANRRAMDELSQGVNGPPSFFIDRRSSPYAPNSRPAWFFDPSMAGGGIVMNVGIHSIDRIHWLAEGRAVIATAKTMYTGGARVETEAAVLLELDNGVVASINLTGSGCERIDRTEVICTRGSMIIDREFGDSFARDRADPVEAEEISCAFETQISMFQDAIIGRSADIPSGHEGREIVAAAAAIYRSARTGAPSRVSS